jgi:predicted transcriptional regulator
MSKIFPASLLTFVYMLHRGEIIEKAIRESGYSITIVAQRLGKSRRWMYLLFENTAVSIEHILQIGKIIYHDFNLDFPEIIQGKKVSNEPENKGDAIKEEVSFWKEKYFTLLEEYNALLKQELGKK